jgi:hypothetical protein
VSDQLRPFSRRQLEEFEILPIVTCCVYEASIRGTIDQKQPIRAWDKLSLRSFDVEEMNRGSVRDALREDYGTVWITVPMCRLPGANLCLTR